jgi:hypothetical protein
MAPTLGQLKGIFPSQLTDPVLQMFLDTAIELVEERFAKAQIGDDRKEKITLFIAAHLAHSAAPRVESERVGDYSYSVQGKTGMDLSATYYGQNALLLDTSGTLKKLGKTVATFDIMTKKSTRRNYGSN